MRLEPFKATQQIQTALPPFLHSKGFDVQGPPNVLKSAWHSIKVYFVAVALPASACAASYLSLTASRCQNRGRPLKTDDWRAPQKWSQNILFALRSQAEVYVLNSSFSTELGD